jgi:Cu/Ag efflux pump CusA
VDGSIVVAENIVRHIKERPNADRVNVMVRATREVARPIVFSILIIVLVFSFTLGAYRLSEQQGRFLKLLSGLMMLGLGLVLLFAPGMLLTSVWPGLILLCSAIVMAMVIHRLSLSKDSSRA